MGFYFQKCDSEYFKSTSWTAELDQFRTDQLKFDLSSIHSVCLICNMYIYNTVGQESVVHRLNSRNGTPFKYFRKFLYRRRVPNPKSWRRWCARASARKSSAKRCRRTSTHSRPSSAMDSSSLPKTPPLLQRLPLPSLPSHRRRPRLPIRWRTLTLVARSPWVVWNLKRPSSVQVCHLRKDFHSRTTLSVHGITFACARRYFSRAEIKLQFAPL